jgi:hypothetical protein
MIMNPEFKTSYSLQILQQLIFPALKRMKYSTETDFCFCSFEETGSGPKLEILLPQPPEMCARHSAELEIFK